MANNLVQRFKLQELYKAKFAEDARLRLADLSKIVSGRDGVITIEVEDEDSKRAAMMANAYVEELDKLTHTLAVTEAAQRRLFFEKQLKLTKNSLADAEVALKKMQEETGLIKLDEQGRAIIEAVANLKALVAAKEVQISGMRTFATEQNPDLVRALGELAGLRLQLSKLEKHDVSGGGDIYNITTGKIPEAGLAYIRRTRDVKYHETMFELMAKHYEIARADEAKDAAIIQVLDPAIEPERRTRPKRTVTVIVAALIAGVLAILFAFIWEARDKARQNPQQAERLALLRRYLLSK